jgi:hypothetical protein
VVFRCWESVVLNHSTDTLCSRAGCYQRYCLILWGRLAGVYFVGGFGCIGGDCGGEGEEVMITYDDYSL